MDDDKVLSILLCIVGIVFILMGCCNIESLGGYIKNCEKLLFILIGVLFVVVYPSIANYKISIKALFCGLAVFTIVFIVIFVMSFNIFNFLFNYVPYIFCFIGGLFLGLSYKYYLIYEIIGLILETLNKLCSKLSKK
jgi:hypothetical protein